MKLRNPWMIAYIVFLILCLLFKNHMQKQMWQTVLIATTCSSVFLVIADVFDFVVGVCSKCQVLYNNVMSIEDDLVKYKKSRYLELECENKGEENNQYYKILRNIDCCVECTLKVKGILLGVIKYKTKCEAADSVLKMLAVLSFLIIIVFENIKCMVSNFQDVLTINAFIIVLGLQYRKQFFEESLENCLVNINEIRKAKDDIIKGI